LDQTVLITADNPTEAQLRCGGLFGRAVLMLNFGPTGDFRLYFDTARTAMVRARPFVISEHFTDYGNNVIPQ
jgi:hypothetical protein